MDANRCLLHAYLQVKDRWGCRTHFEWGKAYQIAHKNSFLDQEIRVVTCHLKRKKRKTV